MPRAVLWAIGAAFVLALGLAGWFVYSSMESTVSKPAPSPSSSAPVAPIALPDVSPAQAAPHTASEIGNHDDAAAERRWVLAVVRDLVDRNDAESLIVAALIVHSMGRLDGELASGAPNHLELLERASKAAPSNAAIQWLAWLSCRRAAETKLPCDAARYESALRAADPGNAFVWAGALDRAAKQQDTQAKRDAMAAMAQSERFHAYYATVEPLIYNAIESARVPSPSSRSSGYSSTQLLAIGVSAWLPLPPLPIGDACKVSRGDTLAQPCLSTAKIMRESDSYVVRRLGLNIAERLLLFGSVQAAEIAEEQRRYDWLAHQIGQLNYPLGAIQRLLPSAGGEVELWEAWLTENGIPLAPPVNWARPEPGVQ